MKTILPIIVTAAAIFSVSLMPLCAASAQTPSSSQPGKGLHDISDPELNTLRGRYTVGDNAIAWFGVQMISTWQGANGQILQGTLAISMDFSGGHARPSVSFQPSVSITAADASVPMPDTSVTRQVDAAGLANVGGVVQGVQVAGDNNLANNVVHLNVHDGDTALTGSSDTTQRQASANLAGASAQAGFDGKSASVNLAINGVGTVQQWIRNGSLGQSVQLAADNQTISNLMQIDLVRQSIAGNAQLSQSVAQSINFARGINTP